MHARYLIDIYSMFNAPKKGPDITLSKASQGVSRIHWQNDMSTIFFYGDLAGEYAQKALTYSKCDEDLCFGYRSFFGHSRWHTDEKDFDSTHTHIYNEKVNIMPPEDLHCFLTNIKKVERMYGLCPDGKTKCFLSKEDYNLIQSEYASYYEQEQRNGNIKYSEEYEKNILLDMGVTLVSSFIKTLIDKYLKPWLIDRGSEKKISSGKVTFCIDMLEILAIAIYTGSPQQSLFYGFAVKCLSEALKLTGLDLSIADSIASGIGVYCFSVRNPASLLNIGRAHCVIAGETAGHVLIRCLPKLKYEEPPAPSDNVDKACVVNPEPGNDFSGETTRRRI